MTISVHPRLLVASLVVAGVLFVFDVLVGTHFAVSIAYVGLVLISSVSTRPAFAYWLAALSTVLIIAGQLASSADISASGLANRGLALLAVWITAVLSSRQIRTVQVLREADAELQQQKDRAASTASRAVDALRSERGDRARIEKELEDVEEELEETEQRYRAVFNQTYQFAAVLDPHGAVEEVNETMRGLGVPQGAEIVGTPVWGLSIWDGEARERLRDAVVAAEAGDFVRDEFPIRRPDGDAMIVDLSLKPIRNSMGLIDLIILEARDITQHKRDQSRAIQTQKMEVLGQFASGIAHDFNNLLTVIAGNLELAERRLKDDEAIAERIAKAVNAVFQGRSLTDRILTFARKKQLEPSSVDVKALIEETIGLSRSGLDENTAIESDVAPELWFCWADPAQLQTALLNLLINARDAMPNGGQITVRARNMTLGPEHRRNRPDIADGDYVVIGVHDEGEGIPANILDKVTDPFFTTKGLGSGSGLGLSMVADFVDQSEGGLEIQSTMGLGTTVSLYLTRSHQLPESSGQGRDTAASRGEYRILVVEDDPDVRDTAVSMLSELGYRVTEASDSEEALCILRGGDVFDLLLTDVMMPGDKDGQSLGHLARDILPKLSILYSSAYSGIAEEIRLDGGLPEGFIGKPYHYAELAQKIESLLSGQDGSDGANS
jgi:PAS domain S-box-containing protein